MVRENKNVIFDLIYLQDNGQLFGGKLVTEFKGRLCN